MGLAVEEATSTTLELHGIIWAAMWVLSLPRDIAISLASDSLGALSAARQRTSPRRDKELCALAAALWELVAQRYCFAGGRVKSHCLRPWNALADNIAKGVDLSLAPPSALLPSLVEQVCSKTSTRWEWLLGAEADLHARPKIVRGSMFTQAVLPKA
eukprot:5064759-Pyramimonas_sp.AAC.1